MSPPRKARSASKPGGAPVPAAEPPQPISVSSAQAALPRVSLTRRGARRAHGLHPWIYRSDIGEVKAANGDVVRVRGPRGRELGFALYSAESLISLRFVSSTGERPDAAMWRARIEAAIEYRRNLDIDADAYRLVHSEGDRLPSLIVDRYADYLVVQTLTPGTERLRDFFIEILLDILKPAGVLVRNDGRVRRLEGLECELSVAHGEVPDRVLIRDGRVRIEADLRHGQKTGLFLDQRENRAAARRYARGRLLDGFSYEGAFALQLAAQCDEVLALDISEDAIAALQRNAELNALQVEARAVNVFDELRALSARRELFDTIVLDPPAFAKNKNALKGALAGYKEINLRAMRLLRPGGYLITSSCSYHVDEQAFSDVIAAAAKDVHAEMALVEKRGQSRDHPVKVGMPESAYLKCQILRRLG